MAQKKTAGRKKANAKRKDDGTVVTRCKANRNRVFVHPQGDVLQCERGVFAPGQEVPVDSLDPLMIEEWYHSGLLIEEALYRMYHAADWNARYPMDRVGEGQGGVDIHAVVPETGDEITSTDGMAPIMEGDKPEL
ncbi:MAG: hypothetical protein OCU12_07050 [Methanophagales archaeon]|nr:hypothetical protein [Methanophagales archaeon]